MSKTTTGIILRVLPPRRLCIFSEAFGKIFCSLAKKETATLRMSPGCEIDISLTPHHSQGFLIESIDLTEQPQGLSASAIAWLHHFLELYYFFLPEYQSNPFEYFALKAYVHMLQTKNLAFEVPLSAVSHFLVQTGFYQNPVLEQCAKNFAQAIDPTQGSALPSPVNEFDEILAKNIVLRCLQEHPQFRQFKTISFLYGVPTL